MTTGAKYFLCFLFIVFFNGCIKDNLTPPVNIEFENGAELVHYFEENGDYINSPLIPSIAEVTEVFNNLTNYLVIDIRPQEEYAAGHIEGAINVTHNNILAYLNNLTRNYSKIVLVSKNGQSSAYYAGLLILYGFNNVFSMNFGMAAWNGDFAEDWEFIIQPFPKSGFGNTEFSKDSLKKVSLPKIVYDDPSVSPGIKVRNIIKKLLDEEFSETASTNESSPSIYRDEFITTSAFKICYGERLFYSYQNYGVSHPFNTLNFFPPSIFGDFKSTRYLQILPPERRIILYSYEGNLSAFTVAYLRVLGYNAASLLFGGNGLFSEMPQIPEFGSYAFTKGKIMNFPYVVAP